MFKLIATFLGANANPHALSRRQREIEEYLSKSVDRCDLERRERDLERRGYFR